MSALPDAGVTGCCAALYASPLTTLLLGTSFHPGGARLSLELARSLVLGPESRVLDVACGPGATPRLLSAQLGCRVVGIDYSEHNIASARDAAGLERKRLTFLAAEATALPFADSSFDAVICECSLCTFSDLPRALEEIARVVRPGGRIGISDMYLKRPLPEPLEALFGRALCLGGALPLEAYVEAVGSTGFRAVRTRDVSWALEQTVTRIERRSHLARRLVELGQLTLPAGLEDAGPVLAAARDFIRSRGAGYFTLAARKPA